MKEYREKNIPYLINKYNLKIGAEIGVNKGIFSEIILQNTKLNLLFCVDIWENEDIFKEAVTRLNKFKGRYIIYRNTSILSSSLIKNNFLDFIYIDADHSLFGIYEDMKLWIPKVKIGGIISGHDYRNGLPSGILRYDKKRHLPTRVSIVVNDFCNKFGYKLHILKEKRAPSWWFIKDK